MCPHFVKQQKEKLRNKFKVEISNIQLPLGAFRLRLGTRVRARLFHLGFGLLDEEINELLRVENEEAHEQTREEHGLKVIVVLYLIFGFLLFILTHSKWHSLQQPK